MSHFTVMTIVRKGAPSIQAAVEALLAPYDENMRVAPYVRHTKAELIQEMREKAEQLLHDFDVALSMPSKDEYAKAEGVRYRYDYVISEEAKQIMFLASATDDEIFARVKKQYEDWEEPLDEEGNSLSTYNPNSKWDWYAIGGRWSGALKLKSGDSSDEAKACEVDWDAMFKLDPEEEKRYSEFWDDYVLGGLDDKACEEKHGFTLYKREYFLDRYKTKEEYLARMAVWTTYAVLDEKGWHAPGEMGWFGCSSETDESSKSWDEGFRASFVDTLDPEDVVVIVDCHI